MKLGCQARSFGEGIYPDEATFLAVVRQIGELGFEGLEANWKNMELYLDQPAEFSRILSGFGVALTGAHYSNALWDPARREEVSTDLRRLARFVATAGGSFVVCSSGRPKGDSVSSDTVRGMAEHLNDYGSICDRLGATLAYHNHSWEARDGVLEGLAEHTDPRHVAFTFDTGNYIQGGADPISALRSLGERIAIVHLKDYGKGEGAALGQGELDLDQVEKALRQMGYDAWVMLEEETKPASPYRHATRCLDILRRISDSAGSSAEDPDEGTLAVNRSR